MGGREGWFQVAGTIGTVFASESTEVDAKSWVRKMLLYIRTGPYRV